MRAVDIRSTIETYAPGFSGTYGSLALRYHSLSFHNLYAAMMVHDTGHPIAFHIDAIGHIEDFEGATREGVWWLPSDAAKDILILTNQGAKPLELDLFLYDAQGKEAKKHFYLGSRQTGRYSIRQLVKDGGLTGTYGGLQVRAADHAGSLDTLHAVYDEEAGFSALLKMFDHDPKALIQERDFARTSAWTLRAPMLALSNPDPALNFPGGTVLQPQLFIRNTTGRKLTANLKFNWRKDEATGKSVGPTLILEPHETRRLDVSVLQNGTTLPKDAHWASVILSTNAQPDEIMAVAASYDSTLRYGAQTPFSDQLSHMWEGGQWEYDAMRDSIITAGNGGAKPVQAAFTIFYDQGQQKYEIEQPLQPDEQMWVDVGKLIRERVPDKTGKLLPEDLQSGSYQFRDLSSSSAGSLFEGKVIYDQSFGHVSYGCADCCASRGLEVIYDPFGVPLGYQATNGVQSLDDCQNAWVAVSQDFYNWSTANHAIATTTALGVHTGMAVGGTTSSTYGWVIKTNGRNGCFEQQNVPASGPTNVVAIPTGFKSSVGTNSPDGTLTFTYSFTSSSGKLSDLSSCKVGETVFYPGSATPYVWPSPMVSSTVNPTAIYGSGSSGGFTDRNSPPTSFRKPYIADSFTATQRLQWECPNYNNGQYQNFVSDISIVRRVVLDNDNKWKYQITKSGATNTIVLP